jgi:hypothetical protein
MSATMQAIMPHDHANAVAVLTCGRCQMAEFPPPPEGIVLTHFIVSDDVERSRRF